jgi:dUTP pyrophosphatase
MSEQAVRIQRVDGARDLPFPEYATDGSVGVDLRAAVKTGFQILPSERRRIPVGIKLAIPAGYEAQIRPRSGLADRHGITVLNSPGTLDQDYRDEVAVILVNLGSEPFAIHRGMKIAQMVVAPVQRIRFVEGELDETSRTGGFGSTGM